MSSDPGFFTFDPTAPAREARTLATAAQEREAVQPSGPGRLLLDLWCPHGFPSFASMAAAFHIEWERSLPRLRRLCEAHGTEEPVIRVTTADGLVVEIPAHPRLVAELADFLQVAGSRAHGNMPVRVLLREQAAPVAEAEEPAEQGGTTSDQVPEEGPITTWTGVAAACGVSLDTVTRRRAAWATPAGGVAFDSPDDARRWRALQETHGQRGIAPSSRAVRRAERDFRSERPSDRKPVRRSRSRSSRGSDATGTTVAALRESLGRGD